jgi:hypothetical protein
MLWGESEDSEPYPSAEMMYGVWYNVMGPKSTLAKALVKEAWEKGTIR